MANKILHIKFQLNVFIFESLARLKSLLLSYDTVIRVTQPLLKEGARFIKQFVQVWLRALSTLSRRRLVDPDYFVILKQKLEF